MTEDYQGSTIFAGTMGKSIIRILVQLSISWPSNTLTVNSIR